MTPTFHNFDTTGEAYNTSQWSSQIHDGDLLFVKPEGVYGFLFEAWPIAVTRQHGEFHHPAASRDGGVCSMAEWLAADPAHAAYAESWNIAAGWAIAEGAEILPIEPATVLVDDLGIVPTAQLDPALTAGQPDVSD